MAEIRLMPNLHKVLRSVIFPLYCATALRVPDYSESLVYQEDQLFMLRQEGGQTALALGGQGQVA